MTPRCSAEYTAYIVHAERVGAERGCAAQTREPLSFIKRPILPSAYSQNHTRRVVDLMHAAAHVGGMYFVTFRVTGSTLPMAPVLVISVNQTLPF